IATIPVGQAPQAVNYVPNAVPAGEGSQGLKTLELAGRVATLLLVPTNQAKHDGTSAPTSVALFDQGLLQVLQAAVTGLEPQNRYVLALSSRSDGGGVLHPLAAFTTNPAPSAIVNALGPIRQAGRGEAEAPRQDPRIAPGTPAQYGATVPVPAA